MFSVIHLLRVGLLSSSTMMKKVIPLSALKRSGIFSVLILGGLLEICVPAVTMDKQQNVSFRWTFRFLVIVM